MCGLDGICGDVVILISKCGLDGICGDVAIVIVIATIGLGDLIDVMLSGLWIYLGNSI